ncbi:MAG: fatty acid desaturase [bacterium]|nr:fatty acid desaturase [bacterium]
MKKKLWIALTMTRFFAINLLGLLGLLWFAAGLGNFEITLPFIGAVPPMSWPAIFCNIALFFIIMFGITGGYHRYFSHRTYKTWRWFQAVLALLGSLAAQWGPILWTYHHRLHHKYSDKELDLHSPVQKGFWWAHLLWIFFQIKLPEKIYYANATTLQRIWYWIVPPANVYPKEVKDWTRFWELRLLDRWWIVPPILLGVAMYYFLGLAGLFAFFTCIVCTWHATFTINSVTHIFGSRRFDTKDNSRNVWWLWLFTMGENWHNNHHDNPTAEPQGMYWWEIDLTHYIIVFLSWIKFVQEIKTRKTLQKI